MRVHVLKSTEKKMPTSGWILCFQWCIYKYSETSSQSGYRFIWKDSDGKLKAARGQARLPTIKLAEEMLEQAKKEGWGFEGDLP